jgi:hypothetical protein
MTPIPSQSGYPEIFKKSPELTGLLPERSQHAVSEGKANRPVSMAWISDELLVKTRRVWSNVHGRPVGVEEAVEILTNVKHLAMALIKAKQEGGSK